MEQDTAVKSENQIWLATVGRDQFNWDVVNHSVGPFSPATIRWSSPGREIRDNILKAKEGDAVICYRKDAVFDGIVAVGRIASAPMTQDSGERGKSVAINILIVHPFVRQPEAGHLAEITPEWDKIAGSRTVFFSQVTPEQWSYIRAIILGMNDSPEVKSLLPPRDFPVVDHGEITSVELPEEILEGSQIEARITIQNRGNAVWGAGESFLISCRWLWNDRQEAAFQWTRQLKGPIPPGHSWNEGALQISTPNLKLSTPQEISIEWKVEGEYEEAEPSILEKSIFLKPGKDPFLEKISSSLRSTRMDQVARPAYDSEPDPNMPAEKEIEPAYDAVSTEPDVSQQAIRTAGGAASAPPQIPQPAPSQIVFINQRNYEPPPVDQKVEINISEKTVTLEYKGKRYSSPNQIDPTKLLELKSTSPVEYGESLFKWVINDTEMFGAGNGNTAYRGFVTAINDAAKSKLRFELSLDPSALLGSQQLNLHHIWWEYLKDPQDDAPLALYSNSPFYRLQGSIYKPGAIKADRIKILVAICNPTTLGKDPEVEKLVALEINQERDIIERALKRLREADLAEYKLWDGESGKPVTLENLQQELEEGYHILHIIAHGEFVGKERKFCLVMENDQRGHEFVFTDRFKKTLLTDDLRLIVLASCQSAHYNIGRAFQALGPHFADLGAPAVIAMQARAPVEMAQFFTQHFYDDLSRSGRVDMAMAATRAALYTKYGEEAEDWAIPVLLMSTDDGRLFDIDKDKVDRLEQLKPEIMAYDQLPGNDPEPRRLAQAMAAEARRFGLPEASIGELREMVESIMSGNAAHAPSKPLAEMQDREALSEKITAPVMIDPAELQKFVREEGARLEYPFSVFRQAAAALSTGKHVIFIGPPGTGKTTFAQQICRFAKKKSMTTDAMLATATADWSTFDTIGGYVPSRRQELLFRPGIFLRSICDGQWLVIDEINRAEIDKAFGELFTVLSGQRVDLPYWIDEKQVRILPAASNDLKNWWALNLGVKSYDYVIHPNWRIIAAMNSYDKSYLFAISLAFMRRFAFIDLGLPDKKGYEGLIERWLDEAVWQADAARLDQLRDRLHILIDQSNGVMKRRALGPAILRDIIRHVGSRHSHDQAEDLCALLCEAFLLHAAPQFDGLEREGIFEVHSTLHDIFKDQNEQLSYVLQRIYMLYPHIPPTDWPKD